MPLETKFLRLRTPVTIGSRFGDWEVSWLGGWTRNRLCYLVMVVRVPLCAKLTNSRRSVDGSHVEFSRPAVAILPGHYGELRVFRQQRYRVGRPFEFRNESSCPLANLTHPARNLR